MPTFLQQYTFITYSIPMLYSFHSQIFNLHILPHFITAVGILKVKFYTPIGQVKAAMKTDKLTFSR